MDSSARSGRDRGRQSQRQQGQTSGPRSRSSSAQREHIHRFSDSVAKLQAAQLAIGAIGRQHVTNNGNPTLTLDTEPAASAQPIDSARKSKLSKIAARAKLKAPENKPSEVQVNETALLATDNSVGQEKRLLEIVQFEKTLLDAQDCTTPNSGPKSLLGAKDAAIKGLRKQNAKLKAHADELSQKLDALQRDLKVTSVRELNTQCETYYGEILRLRAELSSNRPKKLDLTLTQASPEAKRKLVESASQTVETKVDEGARLSDKPPLPTGNSRRSSVVPQDDATNRSNPPERDKTSGSPQNSTRSGEERDREREQHIARLRTMNDTLMKANAERIRLVKENGALKNQVDALKSQLQVAVQKPTRPDPGRNTSVFVQTVAMQATSANASSQTTTVTAFESVKSASEASSRLFELEMQNAQLRMKLAECELRVQLDLRTLGESARATPTQQRAAEQKGRADSEEKAKVEPDVSTPERGSRANRSSSIGLKSGFLSVVQHTLSDNDVTLLQNALAAFRLQRQTLSLASASLASNEDREQAVDVLEAYLRSHRARKAFLRSHATQKSAAARRRRNVVLNGVEK